MLQIDYFLAAAKHLSFTEAAYELFTSQSSVSKQIALLEKQIGASLFYRTKRSVRLSAAGIALYENLKGVSETIDEAIKSAQAVDTEQSETLNIGIFSGIDAGFFLPGFLHDFRSRHNTIKLNFERRHFQQLREKLADEEFDLVFTFSFDLSANTRKSASEKYSFRSIRRINTCILLSSSDPLAKKEDLSVRDFKDAKFLIISRQESPGGYAEVMEFFERNNLSGVAVEEFPNHESMLLAVQAGQGVTVLEDNKRRNMEDGIEAVLLKEDYNEIVVVWRKEDKKPALRVFLDELLAYVADYRQA
jgi:DNA-binding transcriptional LysR family regulator